MGQKKKTIVQEKNAQMYKKKENLKSQSQKLFLETLIGVNSKIEFTRKSTELQVD